ncbi:hypothetical protein SpCBS45565_g07626 [Spizellomyces sp. 'palustris']|nr:hypothetical protein SpCBS45565_g07626 [Spizellomyces sp. 'palustris']
MLIAIAGPTCAGKTVVAEFLTKTYHFQPISLRSCSLHITNPTCSSSGLRPQLFETASDLIHHVTSNWSTHFVLYPLENPDDWNLIGKRPFALLVTVDAPLSVRFKRCIAANAALGHAAPSFEDFVQQDENRLYALPNSRPNVLSQHVNGPTAKIGGLIANLDELTLEPHGLAEAESPAPSASPRSSSLYFLMSKADVRIVNHFSTLAELHTVLRAAKLTDPERLRPSWDSYFMQLCNLAARRSNCMKRRVGCILVKDRRIMATGYNGTPRGVKNCNEGGCPRCNDNAPCGSGLDVCLCLHAEENALLEAGRERVDNGGDSILYCNTCPCLGCAKKIVQVGVKEVVYSLAYGMDDMTARLLKEAGVKLRQHSPLSSDVDSLVVDEIWN